jgi:hypothetical protein
MEKAQKVRMEPKIQVSPEVLVLVSRLERPRVLMSCAWTILFVMPCFIFLVWIRNCFLDRNNSFPNRHWHMDGRNINIKSLPTWTITISCYQLHTCLFLVIYWLILPFLVFYHPEFPVVSQGKGTYGCTMLFFCMVWAWLHPKLCLRPCHVDPYHLLGMISTTTYWEPMGGVVYGSLHRRRRMIRC